MHAKIEKAHHQVSVLQKKKNDLEERYQDATYHLMKTLEADTLPTDRLVDALRQAVRAFKEEQGLQEGPSKPFRSSPQSSKSTHASS